MKTNLKRVGCAIALATGLGVHASANASSSFFDSLLNPISTNGNQVTGAAQGGGDHWIATSFSNTGLCSPECSLDAITLSLRPYNIPSSDTSKLSLSIYSSFDFATSQATGDFTGTLLSEITTTSPVTINNAGGSQNVTYVPNNPNINLASGIEYWLLLESNETVPVAQANWTWLDGNTAVDSDSYLLFVDPGFIYPLLTNAALKVEATPVLASVPLPGVFWLMGSALLGFVVKGRRGGV